MKYMQGAETSRRISGGVDIVDFDERSAAALKFLKLNYFLTQHCEEDVIKNGRS